MVDPSSKLKKLCLVGMPAVGKSTVAKLIGESLGVSNVLDTDALIQSRSGQSPREYLSGHDNEAFRRLESEVLVEALNDPEPTVISVAAGAVLNEDNRAALRNRATVVWLRASEQTLLERLELSGGRIQTSPANLRERLAERTPLYTELADIIVDTDSLIPTEVTEQVSADVHEFVNNGHEPNVGWPIL